MADSRCVFIDYDGTLALQGVVPPAHAEAVRRARARGHVILLCTGRCASIIAPEVMALFDGVVASAGGWIRLGEELLEDQRFPDQLGRRAVEVLQSHDVPFVLETPDALVCTARSADELRSRVDPSSPAPAEGSLGRGIQDLVEAISVPEDPAECSFAKISVWGSPVRVEDLAEEIGPEVGALPNSIQDEVSSGELHLRAIDKADGVRRVAEHLGIDLSATVGIGDGMNDLGMLRAAGTAIAIEGAPEAVLEAAEGVTVPGPLEHGIVVAFERLGML
ncbi:haloacid dehalogenase [Brachybacterium ginsengisoli]|uniref:Haloacid dehalogenase n=1 Tax=Brachybacterium ginsengisoli TaxID=1331682 RepID=A0A291GZA1_9MICO|nr:HAD family hydrolase [Brachybacterium ginsengisoli]ATG55472.1 haloacid dehalogenase [Brachybacterium ginsengisoli]